MSEADVSGGSAGQGRCGELWKRLYFLAVVHTVWAVVGTVVESCAYCVGSCAKRLYFLAVVPDACRHFSRSKCQP
jgi:hypothetical protein